MAFAAERPIDAVIDGYVEQGLRLREREQDTRIVARQPLYAPAIGANVRAQRALLAASEAKRASLGRELCGLVRYG